MLFLFVVLVIIMIFYLVYKWNTKINEPKRDSQVDLKAAWRSLSVALCDNKSRNELSLLVLGQLWANNWKLGASINPLLMVGGTGYRDSYHTRNRTWGSLGLCPGRGGLFGTDLHHSAPPSIWLLYKRGDHFFSPTDSEREEEAQIDGEWFSRRSGFIPSPSPPWNFSLLQTLEDLDSWPKGNIYSDVFPAWFRAQISHLGAEPQIKFHT